MAHYDFAFWDSGVRFDAPDANPNVSMRNLHYYLENPFDDPAISLAELLAFSTDHLQRMIANDSTGELAVRITATTSSLNLVSSCFTDDQTKLGLRKARKMAKKTFREGLPAKVGKICAAFAAKYGPDAPEMHEACPSGRKIFSDCADDQVEQHLHTLLHAVEAHVADLGAPLVTEATALKTSWVAVYEASEESTGAKTTTEAGKKAARENLQLMLFLNLLKLAEMFARQPEKLDLFMQQSLLEDHPAAPEPPTPPPGP